MEGLSVVHCFAQGGLPVAVRLRRMHAPAIAHASAAPLPPPPLPQELLLRHAVSVNDPRGDQGHASSCFMTFHRAFLLELENSLLSVAPELKALPCERLRPCTCGLQPAAWHRQLAPPCGGAGGRAAASTPPLPFLPSCATVQIGTSLWTTRAPSTVSHPGRASAELRGALRWLGPRLQRRRRRCRLSAAPACPPAADGTNESIWSDKYAGKLDGDPDAYNGVTTGLFAWRQVQKFLPEQWPQYRGRARVPLA